MSVGDFYGAHLQRPGAAHDAGLDGHARDHSQVGVHRRVGILPKVLADQLPDARYPGGASHENDLVHVLFLQVALGQHRLHWDQDLQEEVLVELFKQLATDLHLEVNRRRSGTLWGPRAIVRVKVEGNGDYGAGVEGEVELGGFHSLSETVDVLLEDRGDAELLPDSLTGVLQQPLAEVLTSQLVITCKYY